MGPSAVEPNGRSLAAVVVATFTMLSVSFLPAQPVKADEFGCDYNLCDSDNPCNRGCTCTYPEGATVGYCKLWYQFRRDVGAAPTARKLCDEITLAATASELAASEKKSYTCTCDSPCSGSVTCTNGCYAFCEENPEGSGRHICIKGCASAELQKPPAAKPFDRSATFSTVRLKMPARHARPLLERLFEADAFSPRQFTALAATAVADRAVDITITNATLDEILKALGPAHAFEGDLPPVSHP